MRKPMSLEHRLKIKKNYVQLVNEMQVEYMLPYFIQENVLTYDMVDDIRATTTSFSMNDKLLQIIPFRGDNAYYTLIASLKYGSGQLHLVDMLDNTIISSDDIDEAQNDRHRKGDISDTSLYDTYDISDSDCDTEVFQPNLPLQDTNKLTVPLLSQTSVKPKPKRRKKRRSKKKHQEELPDVAHLFPYVVANIHKKWRQLAVALGLEEKDLEHIVVIPHEKQSRYAQMVLDIWLEKEQTKATKTRLTKALQAVGARKALDSIVIYEVPKFRGRISRKASKSNLGAEIKSPVFEKSKQAVSALHRIGSLPIRCQVERVLQANKSENTSDATQKTFLTLADKITSTMVEQGEAATTILNAMERLQGIVFHKIYKGSVIIESQVLHLLALDRLMALYNSRTLHGILEDVLVTPQVLAQYGVDDIRLTVEISDQDYSKCHSELLALVSKPDIGQLDLTDVTDNPYTSHDPSTDDESTSHPTAENRIVGAELRWLRSCRDMIQDIEDYLRSSLTRYNTTHISDLLLTLQLIHPPNLTRISTIDQLSTFKGLTMSSSTAPSPVSIDLLLQIHQKFVDKVKSMKAKISSSLHVWNTNYDNTDNTTGSDSPHDSIIQQCIDQLTMTQRILSPNYDFSSLTHPNVVQMTTLETLCYRGLLAYHHVILDKLTEAKTTLESRLACR